MSKVVEPDWVKIPSLTQGDDLFLSTCPKCKNSNHCVINGMGNSVLDDAFCCTKCGSSWTRREGKEVDFTSIDYIIENLKSKVDKFKLK